jgi:nicotinamide-nucleotide amidase
MTVPPPSASGSAGDLERSDADRARCAVEQEAQVMAAGERLGRLLQSLGLMAVSAESCTGGLVARALTETAGSSAWFDRGFVTYTNESKQDALGVSADTLQVHGAVSEAVAAQMASGALRHAHAGLAMAITGIAGPGGAVPGKPVGTVCFGWAVQAGAGQGDVPLVWTATVRFDGDRAAVRRQAALHALDEAARRVRTERLDRPDLA